MRPNHGLWYVKPQDEGDVGRVENLETAWKLRVPSQILLSMHVFQLAVPELPLCNKLVT